MRKGFYKILNVSAAVFFVVSFVACGSSDNNSAEKGESLVVFSAASLTDVLSEIVDSFEVKYKVSVKMNMASSGTLARQIQQGASVDVYISASKKWAEYVDSLGYIKSGLKASVAQNELVLIAPQESSLKVSLIDSSLNFVSMLRAGRLSLGDPTHVPAGKYAKQSLQYFGWYHLLNKKLLPAKDVRSALMVVEMGEAPMGIVYRTDARKSNKIKILGSFPQKSYQAIIYEASVCSESKVAQDFYEYLNSDAIKGIWLKYGFIK